MFIDQSYFKADISLPLDSDITSEIVAEFIERFEKEILIKILGFGLYFDFIQGLEATPTEQKWIDLRDGTDYEIDGVKFNWNGFQNIEKKSLIAFAIYEKIVENIENYVTSSGTYQSVKDNAKKVSPKMKMMRAHNNFVKLTVDYGSSLYSFISAKNIESKDYENVIYATLSLRNALGI